MNLSPQNLDARSLRLPLHAHRLLVVLGLSAATWISGPSIARAANATPPETMTYQGLLVDANGAVLAPNNPANYPVVFRVYDAATGGTLLWTEQQIVTIDKGNFSVLLGEGSEFNSEARGALSKVFVGAGASDRFIGITVTVGGTSTEILPRLRLLPAPYAFLAKQANGLVGENGVPLVVAGNNGQVTVAGTMTATSFAGSGAALKGLSADNIASGTLPAARLPAEAARRAGGNSFSGDQVFSSGKVGIGPGLGGEQLTISAPSYFTLGLESDDAGGVGAWLRSNSPGGRNWGIISAGAQWLGGEAGAGGLTFYNGAFDVMVLGANRNVGIGTHAPLAPLHITRDNGESEWDLILEDPTARTLYSQAGFRLTKSGFLQAGYVNYPGPYSQLDNLGNWGVTSDRRLKKDISPALGLLGIALKLEPVNYRFKNQPGDAPRALGFIAQEVQSIIPSLVTGDAEKDMLTVNYSGFGVIAIGAIQELHQTVEKQAGEIAALRTQAHELASKVSELEALQREVAELKRTISQLPSLEKALRQARDREPSDAGALTPAVNRSAVAGR